MGREKQCILKPQSCSIFHMRPRIGMSCVHLQALTQSQRDTQRNLPFITLSSVLYSQGLTQSYGILGAAEGWRSLSSTPIFSSTIYPCRVGGGGVAKTSGSKISVNHMAYCLCESYQLLPQQGKHHLLPPCAILKGHRILKFCESKFS